MFNPTNNYAFVHLSTSSEILPIITLNGNKKYHQIIIILFELLTSLTLSYN